MNGYTFSRYNSEIEQIISFKSSQNIFFEKILNNRKTKL